MEHGTQTPAHSFLIRFPFVTCAKAKELARAIDYEREAGLAMMRGDIENYDRLSASAREAWEQYRGEK